MESITHEGYMEYALVQAHRAFERREVPVGCVIVHKISGEIVSEGSNMTNETNDGTRHCEIIAIEAFLTSRQEMPDWSEYALYVTVEPCIMCAAALRIVGLTSVIFGCANDRFGGCESVFEIDTLSSDYLPPLDIVGGVLKEKAVELLQSFYERGNLKLPESKRHRRQTTAEK